MSKHTPGPWSFCPDTNYVYTTDDKAIADLAWFATNFDEETDIANAHLIAAAPEMLEVLESIENDAHQIPQRMWEHIQSIIAKAKGGQA